MPKRKSANRTDARRAQPARIFNNNRTTHNYAFHQPEAQSPINRKAPHLQAWKYSRLTSLFPFPPATEPEVFCFCGSFKLNLQHGLMRERQNRRAIRHGVSF